MNGGHLFLPNPRQKNFVIFLSDFRNLNRQLKRKPYPMPKIREILLNIGGFTYASSIYLNMGYYPIRFIKQANNLCTIILPWLKYRYKRLSMGVSNSLDIFQERMNRIFRGFEFIRAYIDDLLIITKSDWSDHLEKLERTLRKLKDNGIK